MTTTPEPEHVTRGILSPRDSALGSPGWAPSTLTVDDAILEYHELGGREYGGGGLFPIDERAKDTHALYHKLFHMVLGTNYCAPVSLDNSKVLDLRTQTGIWAIDTGEDVGSCQVIGADECEMAALLVPPNVEMQIYDINDEWNWRHKFRLIFARHLGGVVTDLPFFINQCYELLEPGGWLEIQLLTTEWNEGDRIPFQGEKIREMHQNLCKGTAKMGRKWDIHEDLPRLLEDSRFQKVEHLRKRVPLGPWEQETKLKRIGKMSHTALLSGLEALMLKPLMKGLEWSYLRVQLFLAEVREELRQWETLKADCDLHVIYAQKPEMHDEPHLEHLLVGMAAA